MAAFFDPSPEAIPLPQQRFVGDFERRDPRVVVTVEGQEPMPAELFDDRSHRHDVDVDRHDLRRRHPPSNPIVVLGDRHQSQEQLPRRLLLVERQPVEQVVGPSAEHAPRAAHRPVRRRREDVAFAPIEQLGEGVLEGWQRPGLADHVRQQLGEQRRFEGDAAGGRRCPGGGFQFVRRQRRHVDDARAEDGRELGVGERVVVRVGAQREQDE